jgi:hypothetical protein
MRELINLISENEQLSPVEGSKSDLQDIEQFVIDNPEIDSFVQQQLKKLLTYTTNTLNKLKLQSQQQPTANEGIESTHAIIDQLASQIDMICATVANCDPIVKPMKEYLDKLKETIIQEFTKEREAGKREKEQQLTQAQAEKLKLALTIASRLKKSKTWGQNLLSAVDRFGEQLSMDFLTICSQGNGVTIDVTNTQGVSKVRLPAIVNPKLKDIFSTEHADAFKLLVNLPFTESPGMGGGIGPGEALLGCLIGNSTSATPGDLSINGETWEIKAGSYGLSKTGSPKPSGAAWIDSSKVKGSMLRAVFDKAMSDILKSKLRANVNVQGKDAKTVRVHEALALADFRPTGLPYLKAVFDIITPQQKYQVLDTMYDKLFSAVKQHDANLINQGVTDSIAAIDSLNGRELAKIQVKLAFIDYGVGHYNSPNFFIYNTTTQDILIIRNLEGIDNVFDPKFNLLVTPATMGKSDKASPGVFIAADNPDEVDNMLGYTRKTARRTKPMSESLIVSPPRQKR